MAQRKITIDLPRSPEALHKVLQMLLQYGLISEKKARNIEHEETSEKPGKRSRWAKAAEEMSEQGYLKGIGDELLEHIHEFRDDFEINEPFEKAVE